MVTTKLMKILIVLIIYCQYLPLHTYTAQKALQLNLQNKPQNIFCMNNFRTNYDNNSHLNYCKDGQAQQKMDIFRSEIRSRAHEQYFNRIRISIAEHQARMNNHESSSSQQHSIRNNSADQCKIIQRDNHHQDTHCSELKQSGCSILSNQFGQLFNYLNEQQTQSLENLSKLADLYNYLRNCTTDFYQLSVQGHSEKVEAIICRFIQRVLQELETKLVAAQYLYHNELVSCKHPSHQYNQDCSIIFMLVMIQKQLQDMLIKCEHSSKNTNNLAYFYSNKLLKLCNQSKVIDRHVLNMLGITNKAITN